MTDSNKRRTLITRRTTDGGDRSESATATGKTEATGPRKPPIRRSSLNQALRTSSAREAESASTSAPARKPRRDGAPEGRRGAPGTGFGDRPERGSGRGPARGAGPGAGRGTERSHERPQEGRRAPGSDARPERRPGFGSEASSGERPARRYGAPADGRTEGRSEGRFEGRSESRYPRSEGSPEGRHEGRRQERSGGRPEGRSGAGYEGRPGARPGTRPEAGGAARSGPRTESRGRPGSEPRFESRSAPRFESRSESRPESRPGARPGERPQGRSGPRTHTESGARPERRPYAGTSERGAAPARSAVSTAPTGTDDDGLTRLSKRMSELGLCSRREADTWIENGWVRVDGVVVDVLGTRIKPDARIEIERDARAEQAERVTIILNKPVGYVSGQAEDGYEPAAVLVTADNQWEEDRSEITFAPSHRRGLAPAGRLDIDSTGMLVLTQDGRVAKLLIGEDSIVEKEYLVRIVFPTNGETVEKDVKDVFPEDRLELLRHGLELDGKALKPAQVSWQNGEQLRIVLREGKKRQIRRMCELVGLRVVALRRIRMGRIPLGRMPVGTWRYLMPYERF